MSGKLKDTKMKLSEKYDVYVTDISIQELISQDYVKLKKSYNDIERLSKDHSNILENVEFKKPFEEVIESSKQNIRQRFETIFDDKIIKFTPNSDAFNIVLDRTYKKLPPFVAGASDKGFKDTLIWMSMLEYFKNNGSNNIIFITNDKGFRNSVEILQNEFNKETGKHIEIKENSFYNTLLDYKKETENKSTERKLITDTEKNNIRTEIEEAFNNICYTYVYDWNWGKDEYEMAFRSYTRFNNENVSEALDKLKNVLENHIFESSINPSVIWGEDFEIVDTYRIKIEHIEKVENLYRKINDKYSDFKQPFLTSVCVILNECYFSRESMDFEEIL